MSSLTDVTSVNDLPDEILEYISISGGPTEYCNFRRAMKRVWEYTTGREDQCIKQFLVTKINKRGTTKTTLCGKRHSMFDQPSYISSGRSQLWHQHGKKHRDNDQPAVITSDGKKQWYQHGKKHRDNDQPAVILPGGTKMWHQHGKKHRDNDQPAVITSDEMQWWYQHGKFHRDNDQPAIISPDGRRRWYRRGVKYTP